MKPTLNVLVTAASRRVALVLALKKGLDDAGVAGKVLVTDVNPLSPAVHVADGAFAVPMSADPDYLDAIEAICGHEDIGLIVPTIDDELPVFSSATARFAALGVFVAVSPSAHDRRVQRQARDLRAAEARGSDGRCELPAG